MSSIALGIVCPLNVEADALLPWFPNPYHYWEHHFRWIRWESPAPAIVIVISKPGKRNAKKATQLLINNYAPQRILIFGSAAAIAPHIQIHHIILATATVEYLPSHSLSSSILASSEFLSLSLSSPLWCDLKLFDTRRS